MAVKFTGNTATSFASAFGRGAQHGFVDAKAFVEDLGRLSGRIEFVDLDAHAQRHAAGPWNRRFQMPPSQVLAHLCDPLPGETRIATDSNVEGIVVKGYVKKPARRAKAPCYYTRLSFTDEKHLHINEIFVNPGLRGAGYGRALRGAIWRASKLNRSETITLVAGWTHGAYSWALAGAELDAERDREQHDANMAVLQKRIAALLKTRALDAESARALEDAAGKPDAATLRRVAGVRADLGPQLRPGQPLLDSEGPLSQAFDPLDNSRMTLHEAVAEMRSENGSVPAGALLLTETYWPCRIPLADEATARTFRRSAGIGTPTP